MPLGTLKYKTAVNYNISMELKYSTLKFLDMTVSFNFSLMAIW